MSVAATADRPKAGPSARTSLSTFFELMTHAYQIHPEHWLRSLSPLMLAWGLR
jgi:hypothetical protein